MRFYTQPHQWYCGIDLHARCPVCQQGTLRIIAVITRGSVIRKILRHLKLAVDPPRLPRRSQLCLCGPPEARPVLSGPTCDLCSAVL
jgi:hypothetical protein